MQVRLRLVNTERNDLSVSGNIVKTSERKFHFDSLLVGSDQSQPSLPSDEFFSGKSIGFVTFGANCTVSLNDSRQKWISDQLRTIEAKIVSALSDPSFVSQLSFACIGISDHRIVDLVSDRQISASRVKNGLSESFFEPIESLQQPIAIIEQGCSTPGMIVAIKLERLPARLALNIDKAIDESRNAYHSLSSWNPSTEEYLPSASTLYLANLGDIWLNAKSAPSHIPSLSNSLTILRKAIEVSSFDFHKYNEYHAMSAILSELFGGSVKTTILMDLENRFSPECLMALELSQLLRLIRNRLPVSRFDERNILLWQIEKRFKLLRHECGEQEDSLLRAKIAVDSMNERYSELQRKYEENAKQLLASQNRLEKAKEQFSADSFALTQQIEELKKAQKKQLAELMDNLEKANQQIAEQRVNFEQLEKEIAKKHSTESSKLLKEQVSKYQKDIEAIKGDWKKEKNDLKTELENQNEEMQRVTQKHTHDVTNWNIEKEKLEAKSCTAKKEIELLRKEKEELIEKIADAAIEIEKLKTKKRQETETSDVSEVKHATRTQKRRKAVQPQEPVNKMEVDWAEVVSCESPISPVDTSGVSSPIKRTASLTDKENMRMTVKQKKRTKTAKKDDEKNDDPKPAVPPFLPKTSIPVGSLINPEAFQKIRANFSLPKLKK